MAPDLAALRLDWLKKAEPPRNNTKRDSQCNHNSYRGCANQDGQFRLVDDYVLRKIGEANSNCDGPNCAPQCNKSRPDHHEDDNNLVLYRTTSPARGMVNIPRVKLGGISPPVGDGAFKNHILSRYSLNPVLPLADLIEQCPGSDRFAAIAQAQALG